MSFTKRDAARIFDKLDVECRRSTGHVHGWLVVDGRRVLPLHYSHGRGEMPGYVPDRFRKAMYLDKAQFAEMIGCDMTRAQYVELLRERGLC